MCRCTGKKSEDRALCTHNPNPGHECIHYRESFDNHCDNPEAQKEARMEYHESNRRPTTPAQEAPALDEEALQDRIDELNEGIIPT
jgi:hypothetical protein